jgi:hypothetical protein
MIFTIFFPSRFCAGNPSLSFVNSPLDIERPGIGLIYIYLFFEGIIFFTLVILIEVCECVCVVVCMSECVCVCVCVCVVCMSE